MYGMRHTVGASVERTPKLSIRRSRFDLGLQHHHLQHPSLEYILKARSRGAKIVTIDPLRTKTGDQSDEHIAIMPGTDGAWYWRDARHRP
jgi:predicted molibdopterin-dependent oxidoreductase YjgC